MKIILDWNKEFSTHGFGVVVDESFGEYPLLHPLVPVSLADFMTQFESVSFIRDIVENEAVIRVVPQGDQNAI